MMNWLPNGLTSLNLVCGVLSIYYSFNQEFTIAALLIIGSLVADGLDGKVARALGISGDFGKELDSLCDGVSFGVAPAFLMYHYGDFESIKVIGLSVVAIFSVCGVLRLARFNTMVGEVKGYFLGMPIPTAGCLVATFVLSDIKLNLWFLVGLMLLWGPLMVSTVKFPDFKGGSAYRYNKLALVIGGFVALGLVVFSWKAIGFALFFSFMVFGIVNTLLGPFENQQKE